LMINKGLKLNAFEITLFTIIHKLHKEKKEFYVNQILEEFRKETGDNIKKNHFYKIMQDLKDRKFIKTYSKELKAGCGKIPIYVQIQDKFLLFYKLIMLASLLKNDEETFKKVALNTLEKIVTYLKNKGVY